MFDGLSCDDVLTKLNAARIPAVKLHRFWDLYEDEEVRAAGLVRTTVDPAFGIVDHVGTPYHASWVNAGEGAPVPLPGQHSREVMREMGYTSAHVATLIERGAVLEGSGWVD
jgi:formyl-CoA transferase